MPSAADPRVPHAPAGRDRSVDVARGIGIILVVFGHLERGLLDLGATAHADILQACDYVLYTTHMPLFFALAGRNASTSLKTRDRWRYLATRPRAVLWPYALWSTVFVIGQQVASNAVSVHHAVPITALLLTPVAPIGIFWFLHALFCAQGLAALMVGHPAFLLVSALTADLVATWLGPQRLGPGLGPLLVHLPFFAAGFLFAERGWRVPAWLLDRLLAVPALCGVIGLALIAYATGATRPVDAATLPISCLGIAALLSVSRLVVQGRTGRLLASVGRASLAIYVLHVFTLPLFIRAVRDMPPSFDILVLPLGTLFGLAASLGLFAAIKWARLGSVLGLSGGPGRASGRAPEERRVAGSTPGVAVAGTQV